MPWGAVAGAVVTGLMSDSGDKNGGAGAQQQSRDPWAPAQPWLTSNIAQGQNLQARYQAQPFNQAQLDAYGNMGAQSDYMRQLVPGLLGTASRQQLGFDRSNPNARPEAYKFDAQGGQQGGLLGSLTGRALGNYGAANPLPQAPQQQRPQGTFTQQNEDPHNALQMKKFRGTTGLLGPADAGFGQRRSDGGPAAFNGGFGEFKYGMDMPAPGSQAYRDMNEFFAYGGADPYNIYGRAQPASPWLLGGEVAGGPGSGGIGAAGGAGAGSSAGGPGW